MITISHREKEGKKVYKKLDKLKEENSDKINSITDIKELRDFSIHLANELHGFQHMYYELYYKIDASNQKEFEYEFQFKKKIFDIAADYNFIDGLTQKQSLLNALDIVKPRNPIENELMKKWIKSFKQDKLDKYFPVALHKDYKKYLKKTQNVKDPKL